MSQSDEPNQSGQAAETDSSERAPSESDLVLRGAELAMEMVAERYARTSAARALVSLIPGIGGALDALMGGEGARIQERRVDQLIEDLRLDMALLEAGTLDQEFIHSEEFYDWFVATAEKAVRTNDAEKLRALRNVFINGVVTGNDDGTLKSLILRVVGEFTGDHARLLRTMRDLEPATEGDALPEFDKYPPVEEVRTRHTELGRAKFDAIVNDLIRAGVLAGYFLTTYGGGTGQPTAITRSLFGREVAQFLSAPQTA